MVERYRHYSVPFKTKRGCMFSHGKRIEFLEECCNEHRIRTNEMMRTDVELIAELKEYRKLFEHHDKKEMEKYTEIQTTIHKLSNEIAKFNRFFWIAVGMAVVMNFFGVTDSAKHIIKKSVSETYQSERGK